MGHKKRADSCLPLSFASGTNSNAYLWNQQVSNCILCHAMAWFVCDIQVYSSPNGDQSCQWRSISMTSQWPLIMTSQCVSNTIARDAFVKSQWVMMLLGTSSVTSQWPLIMTSQWVSNTIAKDAFLKSQWLMMLLWTSSVTSQWVVPLLYVHIMASQCIMTLLWTFSIMYSLLYA